jgi:hypothetical protein
VAANDFEAAVFPLREDVAGVRQLFGDVAREVERRNLEPDAQEEAVLAAGGTVPALDDGDSAPIALMTGSGATVALYTPLAGVAVGLEVNAPPGAGGTPPVRVLETRTAERVAAIAVSE